MTAAARRLAHWGLLVEPEEEVREQVARLLLDALGNAVSACLSGAAAPAVRVAAELGGPAQASLLGTRIRIGAPAAALATGALVHAHDFDDTHAGGLIHATAAALPASLAVAEQYDASGWELLDALTVGIEVGARIAAATPHAFHRRGLHATAIGGVFASALVAARLSGLDEDRTVHALGIAGSSAGGLLEFLGTAASTKQLHPGLAAHAGILATRLATAGATGPETVLEGSRGVYAALADTTPDLEVLTGDLGERWEALRVGIKPYPSCQLMHAALGAAEELMSEHHLDPADITEIATTVHPDSAGIVCEPGRDHTRPQSGYDAKFSLAWSVAALLVDGRISLATYADDALERPEVTDLAGRVRVEVLDPGVAAADAPGEITVTTTDGRRRTARIERSAGGPDNPLSEAALLAKFHANCRHSPAADELARAILGIEGQDCAAVLTTRITDVVEERTQ